MDVTTTDRISEAQTSAYLALGILIMAILARPFLPAWYDENYTLIFFVDRGPGTFFFDYHLPNNHVLYSFTLWAWRAVLGDGLVTARLLSLLLTALALPGLYLAGRALGDARIGIVAALMLALSHIVAAFAGQLRGYGMSIGLIALALGFAARWQADHFRSSRHGLAYAAAGGLAIAAIPSNLLFVFAISVWLVIAGRAWRAPHRVRILLLAAAPLLGFLAYAGMWAQFRAAGSHAQDVYTYRDFITLMLRQVFVDDSPWSLPLIAFGLWRARGRPALRPFAWLGLAVIGILLAPAVTTIPFDRNFVPLLVFVSLLSAVGLVALGDALPSRQTGLALLAVLVVVMSLGRELVLRHGEAKRFAQAQDHPQNLIDQYYRGRAYNPEMISAFIARLDQPSVVIAGDAAAMDAPAMWSGANRNVATCVTARGARGCALHVGAPRPGPMFVVAPDIASAQAALAQAGIEGTFRLLPTLHTPGYYQAWRVAPSHAGS